MSQEVGVTEHVLLIDHKAEERKIWIINFKGHLLLCCSPDRAEAVVVWKRPKLVTDSRALPPQGKPASAASASNPSTVWEINSHPHPGLRSPEGLYLLFPSQQAIQLQASLP